MLQPSDRLAIYMEGAFEAQTGKMGLGLLRYSPHEVVCVVDSVHAGTDLVALTEIDRPCPIVPSVEAARAAGANVLVLGIAPPGGLIPLEWWPVLDHAVHLGFSLVNGLHDRLGPRYTVEEPSQWIWDVRTEPPGIGVGTGAARSLGNRRALFVGSDMSVGKMTAGLEVYRLARERGVRVAFVATGQIGITIMGSGVPLDAVRLDYASGAVEQAVLAASDADLVLVEGQGSLVHPGSSANLPLLRGACPTHLVLCHRAGMDHPPRLEWLRIPPLRDLAGMYEDLGSAGGVYPRPTTSALALNTGHMTPDEADRALREHEAETGWPTVDPVRQSPARLLDALLA